MNDGKPSPRSSSIFRTSTTAVRPPTGGSGAEYREMRLLALLSLRLRASHGWHLQNCRPSIRAGQLAPDGGPVTEASGEPLPEEGFSLLDFERLRDPTRALVHSLKVPALVPGVLESTSFTDLPETAALDSSESLTPIKPTSARAMASAEEISYARLATQFHRASQAASFSLPNHAR